MTLIQRAVGQDRLLAFAAIVVVVVVVSSWPLASPLQRSRVPVMGSLFFSAAPLLRFHITRLDSGGLRCVVHTHTHIAESL